MVETEEIETGCPQPSDLEPESGTEIFQCRDLTSHPLPDVESRLSLTLSLFD